MRKFDVTIASSGTRFSVRENEPVLDAALRQGVMLSYSCRKGSCASCHGRVLSGRVHYPLRPPEALEPALLEQGEALFCQAVPLTDLVIEAREIDAIRDLPVQRLPGRVRRLELLSDTVARLMLGLPKGKQLQYLAGQYIDILLGGGRRRAFSLANAPTGGGELELHVRYVAGGDFTEHVFNGMRAGEILRFEGPLGTFFLRGDSNRPRLMMAGGTGFAPLKAMLEHSLESGMTTPVHLFWGARNRGELYQYELARRFEREHEHIRFTPVLSEPALEDDWSGETGMVHEALLRHYPQLAGFDVYMSGPPAMIDAGRRAFLDAGAPDERLFYDSFDFAPR